MHRHVRAASITVAALAVVLAGATPTAATNPTTVPAGADDPDPIGVSVIRPTPYVAAQSLIELDGATSLQWQVSEHTYGAEPTELDATANLFVVADTTLAFASRTAPVGSVLGAPDEVVALPLGSAWTIRSAAGTGATATVFGLGHEQGGTSPAGEPFTVGTNGWYQLEVRAFQLLPGELAEVGDGSASTLLLVRHGTVATPAGELSAGARETVGHGELINTGADAADVVAAAVIAVPADLAMLLTAGGAEAAGADGPQTTAPQGSAVTTAPAPAGSSTTMPPSTTEAQRAPTAANDAASLRDGRALIDANGSATITINVMSNDDRGNPAAMVVSVDGSESNVGENVGGGSGTTRINADGTATFSTSFHNPAYSVAHSVQYEIENEHGRSMAIASFEIFFCPEGGGSSC